MYDFFGLWIRKSAKVQFGLFGHTPWMKKGGQGVCGLTVLALNSIPLCDGLTDPPGPIVCDDVHTYSFDLSPFGKSWRSPGVGSGGSLATPKRQSGLGLSVWMILDGRPGAPSLQPTSFILSSHPSSRASGVAFVQSWRACPFSTARMRNRDNFSCSGRMALAFI